MPVGCHFRSRIPDHGIREMFMVYLQPSRAIMQFNAGGCVEVDAIHFVDDAERLMLFDTGGIVEHLVAIAQALQAMHRDRADIGDAQVAVQRGRERERRSEEHTSELQSLMRISYAVFCLKKKK